MRAGSTPITAILSIALRSPLTTTLSLWAEIPIKLVEKHEDVYTKLSRSKTTAVSEEKLRD